jgi:MFS family permease
VPTPSAEQDESGEPAARAPHPPTPPAHDPIASLRSRDFRLYLIGNFVVTVGQQMQTTAIGWELYERTNNAFNLGLVGLVQMIPVILLVLHAGHVADRFDRKRVAMIALAVFALSSAGLAVVSARRGPIALMYGCLFAFGVARAFYGAARGALLPQLVPREHFGNAVTWSSAAWQLAAVAGPALGGTMIAVLGRAAPVFAMDAAACLTFLVLLARIRGKQATRSRERATVQSLFAGVRFLTRTDVLLAAITLDMVAVLLGGATALMPVFARDILKVGPAGLGWLNAAPSMGAVLMAVTLATRPPLARAGRALLTSVIGFGIATIVFGLSRSFPLSLAALFVLGALDNVSVVIRSALLQLMTPDELRGRVASVNSLFIGTSNELGGFESGALAAVAGPVFAVVAGGVGTVLTVLAIGARWPALRHLGRVQEAA